MKQRCGNPKQPSAPWYYDKGIKVCDEWLIYSNFEKWALSNGYSDNLTIDRIDSDGNYEPGNCQWITKIENTRKSHAVRRNNQKSGHGLGRFMVVKAGSFRIEPVIVKVVKTGLSKHESIELVKTLEKSEKNRNFSYYSRVADGHKEGCFAVWGCLRQYANQKKK